MEREVSIGPILVSVNRVVQGYHRYFDNVESLMHFLNDVIDDDVKEIKIIKEPPERGDSELTREEQCEKNFL